VRKLLFVSLVLAVLAAYGALGTGYLKQRRERVWLASELGAARQSLALVPAPPADLDQRLQQALADEKAAREALPERLDTTQALDAILLQAEADGVKAIPLVTQPWMTETVNGHDYSAFRLALTVTGDFSRVKTFLASLETGSPGTLVVEYLHVTWPAGEPMRAEIRVVIYARPPEPP
jgi:hypothetical protein